MAARSSPVRGVDPARWFEAHHSAEAIEEFTARW